ncbi:MAG: VWA domain-containing protein [Cyclobacteriaceae bacterium]|nr:VWA domain-containing protein [Cyclobacteriaceae bacterium]
MTNISTTYSFWWVFICLLVGAGYAWLQYSKSGPWSKRLNYILAILRFLVVSFICVLLLEPFVQTITNYFEKPLIVLAIDTSESISIDYSESELEKLKKDISRLENKLEEKGYEVKFVGSNGIDIVNSDSIQFTVSTTDLSAQLNQIKSSYKERNLSGIVLLSDGLFNEGYSPLAISFSKPIYTIGLGDTSSIKDLSIKEVVHNSTVYEGNSLQLEVQILNTHMGKGSSQIKVFRNRELVDTEKVDFANGQSFIKRTLSIPAKGSGKQSMQVVLEPVEGEYTPLNNSATIYYDVIDARKRILLLAAAPHPDIKAIKASIEQNEYYEVDLAYKLPANLDYELIILHEFPTLVSSSQERDKLFASKVPKWLIVGDASDFRFLQNDLHVLSKDSFSGKDDFVRPVWNADFGAFTVSIDFIEWISDLPPVASPYGLSSNLVNSKIMLYKQIGNITTPEPLLAFSKQEDQNFGILFGTGIWRWKLDEYRSEQTQKNFDDLISKTVQYLSSDASKKRFYVSPKKNSYEVGEEVGFTTEQYNALFERVVGNKVTLNLKNEEGVSQSFSYVPINDNYDYKISNLKEGVYTYTATAKMDSITYSSSGQFVIKKLNKEALNPVADFGLLQKLADKTNATFTPYNNLSSFLQQIDSFSPVSTIHSNEKENPLNAILWVLIALMALITSEWFLRKFYGGY